MNRVVRKRWSAQRRETPKIGPERAMEKVNDDRLRQSSHAWYLESALRKSKKFANRRMLMMCRFSVECPCPFSASRVVIDTIQQAEVSICFSTTTRTSIQSSPILISSSEGRVCR